MPAAEYKNYLRTLGASEDDIKALTEGSFAAASIRAFDKQQADAAAEAARIKSEADAAIAAYKQNADQWYETVATPALTKAQQDATSATAEAARLRSLVAQSQDEGLKAVAKQMGINVDGSRNDPNPPTPPNPGNPGFDPNKYVAKDDLASLMDRAGDGLAQLQDMVLEHTQLFPTQRLDVRKLRAEAVAAKKSAYEYWEQKYKVSEARDKQAADARAADEARIRKEERDKVTREFAEAAVNPNLIPGSTSINPMAPRPAAGREKQPWEGGLDGASGSGDRVARAAKIFAEKQATGQVH